MKNKSLSIQIILETSFSFFKKNFFKLFFVSFLIYLIFYLIILLILAIYPLFRDDNIHLFLFTSNILKSSIYYYSTYFFSRFLIFPFILTFFSIFLQNDNQNFSFDKNIFKKFFSLFPLCFIFYILLTIFKLFFYSLIFIPGIIFSIYIIFSPILIAEGKNIVKSISISFRIVKNNFKNTFLFFLATFFIYEIFIFIISEISHYILPLYTHTFFDNLILFNQNFPFRVLLNFLFESIIYSYIAFATYNFYIKIKKPS